MVLASALISRLAILSSNEIIDDVNTKDLRCLLVDGLRGQMEIVIKTKSGLERIAWLEKAKLHFISYIALIDRYEVIPEDKRNAFAGPQHSTQDPTRRRESKIAQYKMEKEIKTKLEELRKRRLQRRPIASTSTAKTEEDDGYYSDDDESEISRPLFINLLNLHYLRAHTECSSIEMELELLKHGMAMSDLPSHREQREIGRGEEQEREEEDQTSWKMDKMSLYGTEGPLLDVSGKILRPFTILPSKTSALSTRVRLQSEVFRDGHRLPTMTIDEYLDIEQANGNILQGGGPSSSEAVDQARADEKGAKEEDNQWGIDQEEAGLKKAREWDDYKDEHRKGEGNMHNRG